MALKQPCADFANFTFFCFRQKYSAIIIRHHKALTQSYRLKTAVGLVVKVGFTGMFFCLIAANLVMSPIYFLGYFFRCMTFDEAVALTKNPFAVKSIFWTRYADTVLPQFSLYDIDEDGD